MGAKLHSKHERLTTDVSTYTNPQVMSEESFLAPFTNFAKDITDVTAHVCTCLCGTLAWLFFFLNTFIPSVSPWINLNAAPSSFKSI